MMIRLSKPALALAAVLLAAACAPAGRWENRNLPPDEWRADEATCRRKATAEADKEMARDPSYLGNPAALRGRTLEARMSRYDGIRTERRYFSRCMAARGYRKVDVDE